MEKPQMSIFYVPVKKSELMEGGGGIHKLQ